MVADPGANIGFKTGNTEQGGKLPDQFEVVHRLANSRSREEEPRENDSGYTRSILWTV
jgi:hypothetical protein